MTRWTVILLGLLGIEGIVGFGFVNFGERLNLDVRTSFRLDGGSDERSNVRAMSRTLPGIGGLGLHGSKGLTIPGIDLKVDKNPLDPKLELNIQDNPLLPGVDLNVDKNLHDPHLKLNVEDNPLLPGVELNVDKNLKDPNVQLKVPVLPGVDLNIDKNLHNPKIELRPRGESDEREQQSTSRPNYESTSRPSYEDQDYRTTSRPSYSTSTKPQYQTSSRPNYETTSQPNYQDPNYETTYRPTYETSPSYQDESYETTRRPSYETTRPNYETTRRPNYETTSRPSYETAQPNYPDQNYETTFRPNNQDHDHSSTSDSNNGVTSYPQNPNTGTGTTDSPTTYPTYEDTRTTSRYPTETNPPFIPKFNDTSENNPNTNGSDDKNFIDWILNPFGSTSTTPLPTFEPQDCPQCECGLSNLPNRIVGGTEARILQYPWVTYLTYKGKFYCGASIISDRYFLTAAHCVDRFDKNQMKVIVGDHDRNSTSETQTKSYKVIDIIKHNGYSTSNYNNDIALIKIDGRIKFEGAMRPVCLPDKGPTYAGKDGIVTGWGAIEESGVTSDTLQEVVVPILTNAECRATNYPARKITDNMLCAGFIEGGKDSCQGDSGGPLHVLDNSVYKVVGVVSWGEGCAAPGYPGVYARVNRYLTWIELNSQDSCRCESPSQS